MHPFQGILLGLWTGKKGGRCGKDFIDDGLRDTMVL